MGHLNYPRDLLGYRRSPPDPAWPRGARLALSLVVNYEEGGEHCVLHGDAHSEARLTDMPGSTPRWGKRDLQAESAFEYGSRVGIWRLLELFRERELPITVFGVGMALERNPEVAAATAEHGHELAPHGWRWMDYLAVAESVERAHIDRCVETARRLTGERPLGWYTGLVSPNTRRLVVQEGGFLYDSDAYNDDLPYWQVVDGRPHLVVPYSLDNNDGRLAVAQGMTTGEQFSQYLRDAFDWLYRRGEREPRMMSVGLHCRLVARPGRIGGLARFLDYVGGHDDVWICRRVDIARHWIERHPYRDAGRAEAS